MMGSLKLPGMIDITAHIDEWSTDPPTEGGWYWATGPEIKENVGLLGYADEVLLIYVYFLDCEMIVVLDGGFCRIDFTHWLGPLPKPEPPEGVWRYGNYLQGIG